MKPEPVLPAGRGEGAPATKPHVMHVVGTLGAGGVQRLILGVAATEAGQAYRHSVLCLFGDSGSLSESFRRAAIPVGSCAVPWPSTLDLGSYRLSRFVRQRLAWLFPFRFAREIGRRGADLVHTHVSHRIDLQAEGAVRRAGVPLLWTIHGQYHPEGRELERWRKATRLVSEKSGGISAVAEELARDFRARGLDHPDGISITRGGVELSAFLHRRQRDPLWRDRWKIPPHAVVFGSCGRLVTEKAYEVFVRAAGRIVAEGADAHFVIAGRGPLEAQLRAEIARGALEGRFHLAGFVDDVPGFLRELDVFVLSSRFEGFPVALVEALAAERPCIATSIGGIREMVGAQGALVVSPESAEDLAAAMRQMLSPQTRAGYAARGPQVARRFSIDHTAEGFSAMYERLLTAEGSPNRKHGKVN